MLLTIRETDDITQADLAKKCRVSRGLICDIEKGRRLPTLEQVKIFAEKLGYPIQGFLAQVLEDQLKSANLKNYKVKVEAAS
ncbi:MAG: helix-turn-helix transcriptional regulator [Bacteriovoracaceae bacterium]|nr:helix-turn-helix transcriptional regulator [Bacteriovoracaceae bacterium]